MKIQLLFNLILILNISYILCINTLTRFYSNFNLHIESYETKNNLYKLYNILNNKTKCKHIYLDIGTNIGIQIRKLYESNLYPNSLVLPYFNKYYGNINERNNVCTIGIEPNNKWSNRLKTIEKLYNDIGYNVVIFTNTAANINNKNVSFYIDPKEKKENYDWGASMHKWNNKLIENRVGSISLSDLIHLINLREGKTKDSSVFMKLDVESVEYQIIPDLVFTGTICNINSIACEWHPYLQKNNAPLPKDIMRVLNWLMKNKQNCVGELISMDDEEYGHGDPNPLPGEIK